MKHYTETMQKLRSLGWKSYRRTNTNGVSESLKWYKEGKPVSTVEACEREGIPYTEFDSRVIKPWPHISRAFLRWLRTETSYARIGNRLQINHEEVLGLLTSLLVLYPHRLGERIYRKGDIVIACADNGDVEEKLTCMKMRSERGASELPFEVVERGSIAGIRRMDLRSELFERSTKQAEAFLNDLYPGIVLPKSLHQVAKENPPKEKVAA